ncbi:putative gustatory receptor 58a isoform 1-T1 [Cochliomyia hominivorax]
MQQQLIDLIYHVIIKIIYSYSLILGLIPGKFNSKTHKFKVTKLYLVYSAFVQIIALLITPLTSPFVQQRSTNYMNNKPILQWTYAVGKVVRIATIVVTSLKIWQNRQEIIDLCDLYDNFLIKYQRFYKIINPYIDRNSKKEEKLLKRIFIYKFFSLHLHAVAITIMYVQMQDKPGVDYYIMVTLNLVQGLYLLTANLQFTLMLYQISLRFSYINQLLLYLRSQKFPVNQLLNCYLVSYEMHMECLQISRLFFKTSQKVTIFMLMKIFTTNIILLYHAVLVLMSNLHSDTTSNLLGIMCVINFYWDTLLVTIAIDKALTLSNQAANILRETWIVLRSEYNVKYFQQLIQLLNQFSDYLACNKLEFCIYGLVNFDKASSFRYFVSALLHLIILVQFDLKNRLQVE